MTRSERNKSLHRKINNEIEKIELEENSSKSFAHILETSKIIDTDLYKNLLKISNHDKSFKNPFLEQKKSDIDEVDEISKNLKNIYNNLDINPNIKQSEIEKINPNTHTFNSVYFKDIYNFIVEKNRIAESELSASSAIIKKTRESAKEEIEEEYYIQYIQSIKPSDTLTNKANEISKRIDSLFSETKNNYKKNIKKPKIKFYTLSLIFLTIIIVVLSILLIWIN